MAVAAALSVLGSSRDHGRCARGNTMRSLINEPTFWNGFMCGRADHILQHAVFHTPKSIPMCNFRMVFFCLLTQISLRPMSGIYVAPPASLLHNSGVFVPTALQYASRDSVPGGSLSQAAHRYCLLPILLSMREPSAAMRRFSSSICFIRSDDRDGGDVRRAATVAAGVFVASTGVYACGCTLVADAL